MNHGDKRHITIEDLLRLKRAERPPAEFWDDFDRKLRAKQLAALVGKRPWWHQLPRVFSTLSRYQFPIGATAILAVTFISVRDYRPAANEPARVAPLGVVTSVLAPAPVAASPIEVGARLQPAEEVSPVNPVAADVPSLAVPLRSDPAPEVAQFGSILNGMDQSQFDGDGVTPSARSMVASLVAAQAVEPMILRGLLGATRGFENRALPVRAAAVEPLTQMTAPSEVRRVRLLSAMAITSSEDASARMGERVASRLSDDQLRDQIHRFGARGDRFLVKF